MRTITIVASELAKVTGHNKYGDKTDTLNKILKRNKLSDVYIPKSNVESDLLKMDKEDISTIKKELKLQSTASVSDIEKAIKTTVLKGTLDKDITESASKGKVDAVLKKCPTLKKTLDKGIKQDLQMKRGNVKEDSNLNVTQSRNNIKIGSRNSEMYNKILYEDPDGEFRINLCGKIDGLTNDCVVETKNRTKRLFHSIPVYEKVQMEAYMFLTGYNKALHIECYNEEQNKTDYVHDNVLWKTCVDRTIAYVTDILLQV